MPKKTDLHRYFETMNNRGNQLSQTDIIKERLLSFFAGDKDKEGQENNFYLSIFSEVWDACSDMDHYFQKNLDPNSKKYENKDNTALSAREVVFGEEWSSPIQNEVTIYDVKQDITKDSNSNNEDIFGIIKNFSPSSKECESDREFFFENENENKDEVKVKIKFKSIIKFEIFLLYVLKFWLKKNNNKDIEISFNDKNLIKTFEDKFFTISTEDQKQEDKVKQFFSILIKLRFFFDNYIIKKEVDESDSQEETEKWCIKKLTKTKNKSNFLIKNTFDDKKQNDLLIKIQSCLHVTYQNASNDDWLYTCLKWLYDNEKELENKNKIDDFIKVNESYAQKRINDYKEQVKDKAYKNGTSTAHIVFNYLDYLIYKCFLTKNEEDKGKALGLDIEKLSEIKFDNFSFSTARISVEHWYPQNPDDSSNLEKIEDADRLNDFGNLALVTSSMNSRNGNLPPKSKKDYLKTYDKRNFSLKLQIMMALTKDNEEWMSNDDTNEMAYSTHSYIMRNIFGVAIEEYLKNQQAIN